MKVGSLFSGGGLGDFGFMAAGMEIVWQCEIDDYCQKVLALRYPYSKKYRDIKTLKGEELGSVDIITGGFPCQPFSVAGKQQGTNDNRHLWPEMFRIISEVRPTWVVGENISGFIKLGLDLVLNDLESIGYEATTIVFPAHALGAPHRRERVWIVANADTRCSNKQKWEIQTGRNKSGNSSEDVANTSSAGERWDKWEKENAGNAMGYDENTGCAEQCGAVTVQSKQSSIKYRSWWQTEPAVGRVVDGCANRVDRLKLLGNGQVPACTYVIGKMIMEIEDGKY